MTNQNEKSRVLTLVFTDLADSTALKTERGDEAVRDLIRRHREHVTLLSGDSSGRIIDWAGDGCFLTFDTSSAAVMFALRLQQAHADEPDLPGVRIGIHMGEVTESPGPGEAPRIEGLAVDLAARISGLAKPGQVLMSSAVYNSTRQRLGVEAFGQPILWQAHGTYELKGFDEPLAIGEAGLEGVAPLEAPRASEKVKLIKRAKRRKGDAASSVKRERRPTPFWALGVIALLIGALAYVVGTRRSEPLDGEAGTSIPGEDTAPITSIAVLPLDNLMNDPDQDYFADGMTEAIIAELAKIKSLKIISRTSVMQYKGTIKTMPQIAAELGVEGLIEGSVLLDGDDVRITVQLIDGRTDAHVWSESYTNTITSVLQLQAEVALAIADEVRAEVTSEERQRIASADLVNREAYDLYLRGMSLTSAVSPQGLAQAEEFLRRATEIDPEFALAWAGRGTIQTLMAGFGVSPPRPHDEAALEFYERALSIDDGLAQAQANMQISRINLTLDWEGVRRSLEDALARNPNSAVLHSNAAAYYLQRGEHAKAVSHATRALELDPKSIFTRATVGYFLLYAGYPEQGRAILEELVQEEPNNPLGLLFLTTARIITGRIAEALESAERFSQVTQNSPSSKTLLAILYAYSGQRERALAEVEAIVDSLPEVYVSAGSIASVYGALGDVDNTLLWLERGLDEPITPFLVSLRNPVSSSDPLLQEPRYWALIERAGYPPLPADHPLYQAEQDWFARKAAAEEANAPIRKIAVLPFDNLSSDPEQEFFVDGMTEALISELAKIKSLKVISRTSVMRYKNTDKSLTEIARELKVDAIVEGSVLKAGNEVRITAQLIHGLTDEHLWAASRTAPLENILQLQAEVALSMADEINVTVTQEERTRIASAPVIDSRAYELYIEGRALWNERTAAGFDGARDRYERALEIDPGFALAHLGLADTHAQLADYLLASPMESYERSWEHIQRAFELGNPPGEAYSSRARIKWLRDLDWEGASADFERALELNPADATAHLWYSVILEALGRDREANRETEIAVELNPFSPVIVGRHLENMIDSGLTEEALKRAEEVEIEFPDSSRVMQALAHAYVKLGQCDTAVAWSRRQYAQRGEDLFASILLANILARCGDTESARNLLEAKLLLTMERRTGASDIAMVYAILGERDMALEWLERALEWRDPHIVWTTTQVEFEVLHDDPRFKDLLHRMNLPEPEDSN